MTGVNALVNSQKTTFLFQSKRYTLFRRRARFWVLVKKP